MKKLIILTLLLSGIFIKGFGQNANRSGLFIEAGAGFLVGTPPVSKLEWKNNQLNAIVPGGPDVNLAIGYRGATSKVFAWQIKGEVSADPSNGRSTFQVALMPGIRYTTKELFGNISLYFGLDIGPVFTTDSYYSSYNFSLDLNKDDNDRITDGFGSLGAKFGLSAGFNITTSFYGGLYWDYSLNPHQANVNALKNNNRIGYDSYNYSHFNTNLWGSIGIRLGYRF